MMTALQHETLLSLSLDIDFESLAFRHDLSNDRICPSNYDYTESVLSRVDSLLTELNEELEVSYSGK